MNKNKKNLKKLSESQLIKLLLKQMKMEKLKSKSLTITKTL